MQQLMAVLSNLQFWGAAVFGAVFVGAGTRAALKAPNNIQSTQLRHFLSRFLISGVIIALLVAVMNYLINPLGLYSTPGLGPVTTNSRYAKVGLWKKLPSVPDVVMLGSSRSLPSPTTYLAQNYGRSVFNAAFFGGTPRDYYAFASFLRERNQLPRLFFVELGLEQFNRGTIPSEPIGPLGSYVLHTANETLDQLVYLLNIRQTEASVKSVLHRIFVGYLPIEFTVNSFRSDGSADYSAPPNLDLAVDNSIATIWIGDVTEEVQVLSLQKFLALCHDAKVAVVLYFPPYHPRMLRNFEQSAPYVNLKKKVLGLLQELKGQFSFNFYDLTDITTVGGNGGMFHDGLHPSPEADKLIIDYIMTRQDAF